MQESALEKRLRNGQEKRLGRGQEMTLRVASNLTLDPLSQRSASSLNIVVYVMARLLNTEHHTHSLTSILWFRPLRVYNV